MGVGEWLTAPVAGRALRRLVPSRLARIVVRRHLWRLPSAASTSPGNAGELEVFLRVGPRDLGVVASCLASLRRYLVNPVTRVVASTPDACVEQLRRELPDVEVVADDVILPAAVVEAIGAAAPPGRAGWVTQQFLSMFHVSTHARSTCLVWDADTLMLRPHTLLTGNVATIALASEHVYAYFDLIRRLFSDLPLPEHSSTTVHHMVVAPDLIGEMFAEIERNTGTPWWRAILARLDRGELACMSDYELYGQWVRQRHPDRVRIVGFRNMAIPRDAFSTGRLEELARRNIDSVSLHWWVRRAFRA
jgi:hypothetical protein